MRDRPGRLLLCATLALASQHCVSDFTGAPARASTSAQPASSITMSGEGDTLTAFGTSLQLAAVPRDAHGAPLTRSITWISDAPQIVSVDSSGNISGHQNGSAVIHALADGQSASVTIVVWQRVASVTINPPVDTLDYDVGVEFTAIPRDSMGAIVSRQLGYRWLSSDDFTVDLRVNQDDPSRAVATRRFPGQVTITVSTEQLSGSATAN